MASSSTVCKWCQEPVGAGKRADSRFCSTRCRQASHRFGGGYALRPAAVTGPARFAYADPPYPGLARRHYATHPDYAGEVDHQALLEQLVAGGYDGWALSTSAAALPVVLTRCPPQVLGQVRVAAWFRGERPTRSFRPVNAWEPVIYWGGRAVASPVDARRLDALVHVSRPRTTDPARVVGAKPAAFCRWLFELLGATDGDELTDVFPGSGGVARAWRYASTSTSAREAS